MPLREVSSGRGEKGTDKPLVDVIAIHGLNPKLKDDDFHAHETWSSPKGGKGNLWLRDQLAITIPSARIFIAVYDSQPIFGNKDRFFRQANTLLEEILITRDEIDDIRRPIVFLAHSLGGILVKQALVNAHYNPRYSSIKEAVHGLVFFGVPHAGGDKATVRLGDLAIRIVGKVLPNARRDIIETLKDGSMYQDILKEMFRSQLEQYEIVSFYERQEQLGRIIVPYENATLGLAHTRENQVGLDASHSEMCCFDLSKQHDRDVYELVKFNVKNTYKSAIKARNKGLQPISRSATLEDAKQAYKFGMALEDNLETDVKWLSFKRGDLIEDIKIYTHQNEHELEGRIRSSCGWIPPKSIICITKPKHEKILEQYSSQKLFQEAIEQHGLDFAHTLFGERVDDPSMPQLTTSATSLGTTYVDWRGQLHDQALHFAVIAADQDMTRFLIEGQFIDANKRTDFPALCSRRPKDDQTRWESYVENKSGTPLTAAVNRYVRSKHWQNEVDQKKEVVTWRNMILELEELGAKWSLFANDEKILGQQSALYADAPSVLWRAIDYCDRVVYDLILRADPMLEFAWLPWQPFFESEEWWARYGSRVGPLRGQETEKLIELLREHPELADATGERTLRGSISNVVWAHLECLDLSPERVNILFEQVMAQVDDRFTSRSHEKRLRVVEQLRTVLKFYPNVQKWAGQKAYPSVLHYCVAANLCDILETFLVGLEPKFLAFINRPFEDGDNLLDKAIASRNDDMKALLERYNAFPSPQPHQRSSPGNGPLRTLSRKTSSKSSKTGNTINQRRIASGRTTPLHSVQTPHSHGQQSLRPSPSSQELAAKNAKHIGRKNGLREDDLAYKDAVEATLAKPDLENELVDIFNYSDWEYQHGGSNPRSPVSSKATLTCVDTELSSTAPPTPRSSYAEAVKQDLDQTKAWKSPPLRTRPRPTSQVSSHANEQARKTEAYPSRGRERAGHLDRGAERGSRRIGYRH